MNGTDITVIIPYYNVDIGYFQECIESLKKQTYKNFNIIIVDDGSKEEFANQLDKLYLSESQIKIFHTPNGGVSRARNYGMKMAETKYVCFVDADDYVSKDMIKLLYEVILETKANIVTSFLIPVYNSEYVFETTDKNEYKVLDKESIKKAILIGHSARITHLGYVSGGPCALIIERKLAMEIGFPEDIPYMEDVIWNYKVFDKAEKSVVINSTLYAYRQNSQSATHSWKLSVMEKRIEALNEVKDMLHGEMQDSFALRCLSSYSIICKACIKTDELSGFLKKIKYTRKCLKNPIWNTMKRKGIAKTWDKKQKVKRFFALSGIMPLVYFFKK